MQKNLWDVGSLYDFLCYKCPSCPYDSSSKQEFVNHAYFVHPEAGSYLKNIQDNSLLDIHFPPHEFKSEESNANEIETEEAFTITAESDKVKVEDCLVKTELEEYALSFENEDDFEQNEVYSKENPDEFKENEVDFEQNEVESFVNESWDDDYEEEGEELKLERKNFQCKICHKSYTKKEKLKYHLKKAHDEILKEFLYKCNLCTKRLAHKENLKSHLQKCHNEVELKESLYTIEDYRCHICEKSFMDKKSLLHHNGKFHKQDVLKRQQHCSNCGKIFKDKHALYSHNRKFHSNYLCKWCEESFSLLKSLKNHISTKHKDNTDQKVPKVQCHKCKKMIRKCNIEKHILNHEHKKDYVCPTCGKAYGRMEHLKKHEDVIHKGIKKWPTAVEVKCEFCGKTLHNTSIKQHIKSVHEKIKDFQCPKCGKAFSEKASLKDHDKIHTGIRDFGCDQCGKTYRRSDRLKNHIRVVHEGRKDYVCSDCGKSFGDSNNLKRHSDIIHKGIKRFKCDYCTNAYGQSPELKKHLEVCHKKK